MGRGICETQQKYSNSDTGVDKMSLERIHNERGKKVVKERSALTGDETQTEMFHGMLRKIKMISMTRGKERQDLTCLNTQVDEEPYALTKVVLNSKEPLVMMNPVPPASTKMLDTNGLLTLRTSPFLSCHRCDS